MGDATEELFWDGERLTADDGGGGRAVCVDGRMLGGDPVLGCFAHVCALPDEEAVIPFDQPEVQEARRDALAWWIPLLGDSLVCLSTFSTDSVHCAGAVTVATDPDNFGSDPFARLFVGTVVETGMFSFVAPPAGPLIERIAGAPWPGGSFRRALGGSARR